MATGKFYNHVGTREAINIINKEIEELQESGGGGEGTTNYDKLKNKPTINGVTVEGDKTAESYGIKDIDDYNDLNNRPQINGHTLAGNLTGAQLGLEGTSDYAEMMNKPKINGVELTGDKSSEDLKIKGTAPSITATATVDNISSSNPTVEVTKGGTDENPTFEFAFSGLKGASGSGGGGSSVDVDDALSATSENPVQNKVVKAALDNKVEKVEGKGLSTNDYDNASKAIVDSVTDSLNSLSTAISQKVTAVDGKGLSTNDYNDDEKDKVANAQSSTMVTSISVAGESISNVEEALQALAASVSQSAMNAAIQAALAEIGD